LSFWKFFFVPCKKGANNSVLQRVERLLIEKVNVKSIIETSNTLSNLKNLLLSREELGDFHHIATIPFEDHGIAPKGTNQKEKLDFLKLFKAERKNGGQSETGGRLYKNTQSSQKSITMNN